MNGRLCAIFLVLALVSEDGSMTEADIGNYISGTLQALLSWVNGVGQAHAFGSEYAMRIWLNPKQLDQYNLMPSNVQAAIETQNSNVTAGSLGGLPAVPGQELNATVHSRSQPTSVKQFKNEANNATSQFAVKINDCKASSLGLSRPDINSTLSAALGGKYSDDFIYGGRITRVYMPGGAPYRMLPGDINDRYVGHSAGHMIRVRAGWRRLDGGDKETVE